MVSHTGVIAQIIRLTRDADRSVRTEAVRALALFPDSTAIAAVLDALAAPDSWLSVSAAEGLARHRDRAELIVPRLVSVIQPGSSSALQVVALATLNTLSPDAAFAPATVMARDTSVMVRVAAVNLLRTRGSAARAVLESLQNDPATEVSGPVAAALAVLAAADSLARTGAAVGGVGGAGGAGAGRGAGGGRGRGPAQPVRTEQEYRSIVERWVVPDYNGAARPVAEWVTTRGVFQIELYPGDAPMGVADFFRNVESGALVGVEFSRLVPDFVAQQRGIAMHPVVRDEVSRRRLTRENVSWASAGLDTGRPGYTLAHTPQPHNEGNFTALGRISTGMDVVDRLELGDRLVSARIVSTGR
jgi:cyclophilin family peptidyl-prolyl cis-trans isomerase